MFILKFINAISGGKFYDKVFILITFVLSNIMYFFILIGIITDPSIVLISYLNLFTALYAVIWLLTILEAIGAYSNKDYRERRNNYIYKS